MSHARSSVVLFCFALSCSDASSRITPASGAGAGAGNVAGGTGTAGATGVAGSAPAASGAGNGGMAGSSSGAASVGLGGSAAGAATGGGGTDGGAATAGNAGTAGSGGDATLAITSEIDKMRLECPCIDAAHFGLDKQDNCDATPAVDRQTYVKHLGGDPSVTYDVTLHVRGNTEPNTYVKGTLAQDRFYTGGETSTPGYTAYMLTVADPQQTYFFNYNPSTGHIHFLIDYQVVIPMKGGTTLTFEVNGGKSMPDGHGVSNRESLVVPDVPPAPAPFNGQLVQFDVVSVKTH